MTRRSFPSGALVGLLILFLSAPAAAQVCEPAQIQESLQFLRRASLDLRGRLPTIDELESVVANGEVDPMLIEQMLDTDDFARQMRAYHMDLLWTNLDAQRITPGVWSLAAPGSRQGNTAYYVPQRATRYRGVQGAPCKDEPATFDADGNIETTPHPDDDRVVQEGWVEVNPYWAPETTIKVCAFDAQETLEAPNNPNNPRNLQDCSTSAAPVGCGCGPGLRSCQVRGSGLDTRLDIVRGFSEQLMRFSDEIVLGDRPYTDFVLATDMEINGPLAHYLRFQTRTGGNLFLSLPDQNYDAPDIPYAQKDDWVRIERGERHSGVLTMPGYLVRFQTDRSRANRFYNAFLCTAFEAPPGGLPASDDACNSEPDLTERCGCKHCHIAVEPAAAHWGRYGEAGLAALNEDLFPKFNENCTTERGRNSALCRLFYFTGAQHPDEEPYVGMLNAYVFADETIETNIELGPAALAQKAIESGEFARCTTRKLWTWLMGRDAGLEDELAIETLAQQFARDDHNIRELIFSIVTRPEYIQGERFGTEEATP